MKKFIFLTSLLLLVVVLTGCDLKKPSDTNGDKQVFSDEEARTFAENFINEQLMAPGNEATIKEFEKVTAYRIVIDTGEDIEMPPHLSKSWYMTEDGSEIALQAVNIEEFKKLKEEMMQQEEQAQEEVQPPIKSDKPIVELYVMSHCPYGLQIEKGILPVIDSLGDTIDFKLKFVNYAMHGETELAEELRQVCIMNEQNDKFRTYLKCFTEKGEGGGCDDTAGIDKSKLAACVDKIDKEYKVMENFKNNQEFKGSYPSFKIFEDDNTRYGVQGSPTLVINGQQESTLRDPQSLLNTICESFNTPPQECTVQLSTGTPAAGFGAGTANSSSDAECGT